MARHRESYRINRNSDRLTISFESDGWKDYHTEVLRYLFRDSVRMEQAVGINLASALDFWVDRRFENSPELKSIFVQSMEEKSDADDPNPSI